MSKNILTKEETEFKMELYKEYYMNGLITYDEYMRVVEGIQRRNYVYTPAVNEANREIKRVNRQYIALKANGR